MDTSYQFECPQFLNFGNNLPDDRSTEAFFRSSMDDDPQVSPQSPPDEAEDTEPPEVASPSPSQPPTVAVADLNELSPASSSDGTVEDTETGRKRHHMKTRSASGDEEEAVVENPDEQFIRSLRSNTMPKKPTSKLKMTMPQPFSFGQTNASKKRKRTTTQDGPQRAFKSVAEGINSFSSRTPERFHTRSSKQKWEASKEEVKKAGLVEPHTPHLVSQHRKRAVTAVSHAEQEEREVDDMKKNQFKAQPVNARILHEPNIGVPKVEHKQTTVPCSFHLTRNRRLEKEEEEKYEFRAQPVPKTILKGVTGVKPAQSVAPTVPKSPAFALKNRLRKILNEDPTSHVDTSTTLAPARRGPTPHSGIPFQPELKHQATKVVPFSFAERDNERLASKRQRIQQRFEGELERHDFKATLLPNSSPNLPDKVTLPVTKAKPFHFEVDVRGARKSEETQRKLMQEQHDIAAQTQFKANSFTHPKPFVPQRSKKPLTEANEIELETERRLRDRDEWESWQREKAQAAQAECHLRQQRQQQEAKQELAKMRAQTRFRSHRVRAYRRLSIKASSTALTQPQSPCFSHRLDKCKKR